jgi:hypothetical protein
LNQENFNDLKLYTNNIIEINKEISLLIIYPPSEQICIIPNTDEIPVSPAPSSTNNFNNLANLTNITQSFFKRNSIVTHKNDHHRPSITNNYHMNLPIQVFETLNLYTYDRLFIKNYSKLSTSLDIEYNSTLQYQREAFSNEELNFTKQKLSILLSNQHKLDDLWKESRWLIDIINNVRDRNKITGVSLGFINDYSEKNLIPKTDNNNNNNNNVLSPIREHKTLKQIQKIPSVIVHNENDVEEQASTLIINDDIFDSNNKELSYLSSGYHSDDKYFERLTNIEQSLDTNKNNDDNLFSSISFINLKSVNKSTIATTSKVNVTSTNSVSPTSSSTSTSSISASASSSSSSSSSSAYYTNENNKQKINDVAAVESNSNETNYLKTDQTQKNQISPVTSLTQSFSSLISSVYNFKTIVVHIASK